MPLRMIGAMILGMEALDAGYPLMTAAIAGVAVHMVLSIAFAIAFAVVSPSSATTGTLVLLGIGCGTGPPQAFFFGAPVGWYVGRARPAAGPSTV